MSSKEHGMATTQPESTSGSNVLGRTTTIETRSQAILTRSNDQISRTLHTGSVAMRIPDEILDMIVRQAHKIRRDDQAGLSRSPCFMVSLVCRRWRNIALPYLFGSIKIPFRGQGLQCCSQFFSDNSILASLVHNVDISDTVLNIVHLDHLLASLHGLQELNVSSCSLNGPSSLAEGVVNECVVGNHSIQTLEIHFNNNESSVPWYYGVLEIMALFSEIKEFTLCSNHRNDVQDLEVPDIVVQAAASAIIGGLNISALTLLECPPFMISFLWRFLDNIGGLHDLQSLGISLGIDPEKMLSHMSYILCRVGRKLKRLTVDVPYYVDFWAISSHDSEAQTPYSRLQSALSKCTSLESFNLVMYLEYDHPDLPLHELWLTTVRILQQLPIDHLRDLMISLQTCPIERPNDDVSSVDIHHSLAWHEMRDVCRRFTELHSLDLALYLEGTSSYYCDDYTACINHEMREFKAILKK